MKQKTRRRLPAIKLSPLPQETARSRAVLTNSKDSVMALATMLDAMSNLPTDRAKARVLRFVEDVFNEALNH